MKEKDNDSGNIYIPIWKDYTGIRNRYELAEFLFTFQYGKIILTLAIIANISPLDLHSNMERLYMICPL